MEKCIFCEREFDTKYKFAAHNRYIKRYGRCDSIRTSKKPCLNTIENPNCKGYYIYSKSGFCRSCSAIINFNDIRSGKTYEEMYGEEKAKELKENAAIRKQQWNLDHPGRFAGENNGNYGRECINKGKTWEEIHGPDKAKELKQQYSIRTTEMNNSPLGKQNLQKLIEANRKSENRIGTYAKWLRKYGKEKADVRMIEYSKKLSESLKGCNSDKIGEKNSRIKSILIHLGITYNEYIKTKTDYQQYKLIVNQVTNQQPIYLLENFSKRGKAGVNGAYHLDHIYSVMQGFNSNIPPDVIGHISNLRFIPWKDNIIKSCHETSESFDIFIYFLEEGIL